MDTETRHSLTDLARVAGVTPRTVRYYIAQGLLPGAHDPGPGAWYDDGHLARLRLIRELQRQHLPLADIRTRLGSLEDAEIVELLEQRAATPDPSPGSALDYIRSVLGGEPATGKATTVAPTTGVPPTDLPASDSPTSDSPTSRRPMPAKLMRQFVADDLAADDRVADDRVAHDLSEPARDRPAGALRRLLAEDIVFAEAAAPPATPPAAPSSAPPSPSPSAPSPERSQWDRIALTPDIELHVRRPLSRQDNRLVDRLITIARQVLKEEQP